MTDRDLDAATDRVEILAPGDPGWADARVAWNLSIDQQPALIALPRSADEIASVVAYAASKGLRVTAQGTGHQAGMVDLTDTILIRTDRLGDIEVDPATGVLKVGAGVVWRDAVSAAAQHGLACLSGTAGSVGVTGYTLGGGLSWFSRQHGLAANSVVAMDVVTADGRLRHIDSDHDADLFWAMRGGGGLVGIVAGWEFRLFPVTHVYAGAMFWPIERAADVLTTWARWSETLPDAASTCGRLLAFPPFPEIPAPLRGKSFVSVELVFDGSQAAGEKMVERFRQLSPVLDNLAVIEVAEILGVHGDPPGPAAAHGDGLVLDSLPDQVISDVIERFGPDSPLVSVEFRKLGGALSRSTDDSGVLTSLAGEFIAYCVGPITPAADTASIQAGIDALKEVFAPVTCSLGFANFSHSQADLSAFIAEAGYERLTRIKDDWDPDGRISTCHPVRLV